MSAVQSAPPASAQANVKLLETVLKALPHAHLITDIDLHTQPDVLRFTWRGARYRVQEYQCDEIEGGCLVGSDLAILMGRVLQLTASALRNDLLVIPE